MPSDWSSRVVPMVLTRDPTCTLAYAGTWQTRTGLKHCTVVSTEVDHIGRPDVHAPGNLRGVCSACHRRRTQGQSAAARGSNARSS